ncbi:MAG: alpha/beta fold hydrolase [Rhodospirillaceae bacterium]|nr:alpha/beta fold hydrolase [Rhodospirillaceae bacterium]
MMPDAITEPSNAMRRTTLPLRGTAVELVEMGAGRPIVFLHDDDGVDAALPMLRRLAAFGRVYAPSHPGFGRSGLPPHFRTVDDLAYFHLDLLDRLDLRDVLLVGASFGGWIAAEIAVRNLARISALALCAPVGIRVAADETAADILDVFTQPEAEIERALYTDPVRWRLTAEAVSDEDLHIVARNRESFCLFGWSPLLHNPALRHWLHRIDVPTLVLWGARDGIAAPDYGRAFAGAIPGAKFSVLAGAAHRLCRERPDDVAAEIARFAAASVAARALSS